MSIRTVSVGAITRLRSKTPVGAMGVRRMACVIGATIGPPAESEYAVDPVGVETMSPSPT